MAVKKSLNYFDPIKLKIFHILDCSLRINFQGQFQHHLRA